MEISERITKVREDANLTKAAFAERLNIGASMITMLEQGKREPTKRTQADICEKFNVNPEWLRTGEGEPYNETIDSVLKLLKAEYKLDELDLQLIEGYLELSPIERQVFKDYVKGIKEGSG